MKKLVIFYLILLYYAGTVFAQNGTLGTLAYALDENGTLTISGTGIIPSTFMGTISSNNSAFRDMEYLVIEEGITGIGISAFINCRNLESVTFPGTLTKIDGNAFDNCSKLPLLYFPASVSSITPISFQGCDALSYLSVHPDNPTYSSADGVIFNKNKTRLVLCPPGRKGTYSIPASVNIIDNHAFLNCGELSAITIPNSVSIIETFAFSGAGVTSLDIPEGVTSIGISAFNMCTKMTAVNIPASVTTIGSNAFFFCLFLHSISVHEANPVFSSIDGVLFNKNNKTLVTYPVRKQQIYTVPEGVEIIGESAFYNCRGLKSITFPTSLTTIGKQAFFACAELTFIDLPASITTIGSDAFSLCLGLVEVVNHKAIPQSISSKTFDNPFFSARILRVPSSAINLYKDATEWKEFKCIVSLDDELSLEIGRNDIYLLTNETTVITPTVTGGLAVDYIDGYFDNTDVATVDYTGAISALKPGSTVITVYFGSMKATFTVTVFAPGNSIIKRIVNNAGTEVVRVNLYKKTTESNTKKTNAGD